GSLTQEDILALLAVGITYGELQQMDSGALQTQLSGAAQNYVGQLLARSLREGVGLDQLELTPDLLADSTSLTLNIGKYVLPDLFVAFEGDIFSSEPGTISAQYYIRPDLYLVGSTKSTLHGEQEPSMELHYTLRY
ncbi:MAG TPA: translocation/assembly module TamB domain-containing protein, partial [Candidatus Fermentibacter sp.]|nr:translocation/assembly module TamB domain-containing protein [Candidatus Fermentibacter sp.]